MTNTVVGGGEYRVVRLKDLTTDGRFNRDVSENKVAAMMAVFNGAMFGVIEVWERDDGVLVILDGQHRVETARRRGIPEDARCIPINAHKGLSLQEAAELFVGLNSNLLVSAYSKFNALRTAEHPETLAIDAEVQSCGLMVKGSGQFDGSVACIDALRHVHRLGEPEGVVLVCTLTSLYKAFGPVAEAFRAQIVRGVGQFAHENRDVDADVVAEMMVKGPGAPLNLISWAKALAGPLRMPLHQAIAQVLSNEYAKRKRRQKRQKPDATAA